MRANVFDISGEGGVIHRQEASFEDFWTLYPRRTAKGAALKSWARMTQDARKEALEGLRGQVNYLRSLEWGFIPHPATWLNQMRWLDELPGVQKPCSWRGCNKMIHGKYCQVHEAALKRGETPT